MMDRETYEQLILTDRENTASRIRGAAMISEECHDEEMAKALKLLSAQMDFDDNIEAVDAINRNRDAINKMIKQRNKRHANLYLKLITDEDVLSISSGEVTATDYSRIDSEYLKNGLFDPDIFGGSGKMQLINSNETASMEAFGKGIGHIKLSHYTVLEEHYHLIASLLGMTTEDVSKIAKYTAYVVLASDNETVEVGSILTEKEFEETKKICRSWRVGKGGDALHEMLEKLNLPDHPERLAFKVIPVMSPALRPIIFLKDKHSVIYDPMNEAYVSVIVRNNRCKKLDDLVAPDIIAYNERRMLDEKVNALVKMARNEYERILRDMKNKGKRPRSYYTCQLLMIQRERRIGFEPIKSEKTEDIVSLNIYPKTIKVKDGKKYTDKSFEDIIDACCDSMREYEQNNVIETPYGAKLTKKEKEKCKKVQEHIDKLNEIFNDIWIGAEEKREQFIVRWDSALDFYVPA